jgi:hypothetical protein
VLGHLTGFRVDSRIDQELAGERREFNQALGQGLCTLAEFFRTFWRANGGEFLVG